MGECEPIQNARPPTRAAQLPTHSIHIRVPTRVAFTGPHIGPKKTIASTPNKTHR